MSVIHVRHDDVVVGSVISRVFGRLSAAFQMTHQAIATAKLERLENELVVRRGYSDAGLVHHEVARYPQRPLVLGDKWDF